MRHHWLERLVAVALIALPAGSTIAAPDFFVPISAAKAVSRNSETPRLAQVRVTDVRTLASRALEVTTIGGLSMGQIRLETSVPDLVQEVIETKADEVLVRRGVTEAQTVSCGILAFEVATPATPLYWDIRARIELGLRVGGQERTVTGAAAERTFLWPTKEIIGRVTTTALQQVGIEAGRALEELFAPPR